jgi:hypothetical protein
MNKYKKPPKPPFEKKGGCFCAMSSEEKVEWGKREKQVVGRAWRIRRRGSL